jgi:hypothetical protein
MTHFARLREYTDDDPEGLVAFAATDESVRKVCKDLAFAAHRLKMNERRARVLFASPVDPKFVAAWRDYMARFQTAVSHIWFMDILPGLETPEDPVPPDAERDWRHADDDAEDQAAGIEEAIDLAQYKVANDPESLDANLVYRVEEGVAAWERLITDAGLDLRGTFRRRALVPFILVPRNVAAKHGPPDIDPMLINLRQAHDAFVFGASHAALGLMRSILEAVLRDHYRAEGKDLNERIRSARKRLPPGANEASLHRLRKLANSVLHLAPDPDGRPPLRDEMALEREVVSLLFVLRALIEDAPK